MSSPRQLDGYKGLYNEKNMEIETMLNLYDR